MERKARGTLPDRSGTERETGEAMSTMRERGRNGGGGRENCEVGVGTPAQYYSWITFSTRYVRTGSGAGGRLIMSSIDAGSALRERPIFFFLPFFLSLSGCILLSLRALRRGTQSGLVNLCLALLRVLPLLIVCEFSRGRNRGRNCRLSSSSPSAESKDSCRGFVINDVLHASPISR